METIKCPICGSIYTEMISDEKYRCLACDNEFLIYNRSKEFRETDAHIEDIRKDIHQLNRSLQNNVSSGTNDARLKEIQFDASRYFKKKDYINAYINYKKYSVISPDSYYGYAGMYKAISGGYTGVKIKDASLYDGFDVLLQALRQADCPSKISEKIYRYIWNSECERINNIYDNLRKNQILSTLIPMYDSNAPKDFLQNVSTDLSNKVTENVNQMEALKTSKKPINCFNVFFGILLSALAIFLLVGLFTKFGIIRLILTLVCGFFGLGLFIPGDYEDEIKKLEKDNNTILDAVKVLEENIKSLDSVECMSDNNIFSYVEENAINGKTAEMVCEQMVKELNLAQQKQHEDEIQKAAEKIITNSQKQNPDPNIGMYYIRVEKWGKQVEVIKYFSRLGLKKKELVSLARANAPMQLHNCTYEEACQIQSDIAQLGGIVTIFKQ